jgi:hypothetical protein
MRKLLITGWVFVAVNIIARDIAVSPAGKRAEAHAAMDIGDCVDGCKTMAAVLAQERNSLAQERHRGNADGRLDCAHEKSTAGATSVLFCPEERFLTRKKSIP